MPEHVLALLRRVRLVYRHRDGTHRERGKARVGPLRARVRQDRNPVAWLDAEIDEPQRHLLQRAPELLVGDVNPLLARLVPERRRAPVARRRHRNQVAHRPRARARHSLHTVAALSTGPKKLEPESMRTGRSARRPRHTPGTSPLPGRTHRPAAEPADMLARALHLAQLRLDRGPGSCTSDSSAASTPVLGRVDGSDRGCCANHYGVATQAMSVGRSSRRNSKRVPTLACR